MAKFLYVYHGGSAPRSKEEGAKQMKAWMEAGPLTGYAMFYNTTSFNTPWDSMLVMEYADLAAFTRRDEINWSARAKLAATDPVFKALSDAKTKVRDDKAVFHADAIPLPAP